ncbi:HNH endonuclease [Nocardia nova]|nr:HNH endonuclease [Nocardia nova]
MPAEEAAQLIDVMIATGSTANSSAAYRRCLELVECRESVTLGGRHAVTTSKPVRLQAARRAVLIRSEGRCENPDCGRAAPDVTDNGLPVLDVDHVEDIAKGGRDHPGQMIALCPNCHAVKTRGKTRHTMYAKLLSAAAQRHSDKAATAEDAQDLVGDATPEPYRYNYLRTQPLQLDNTWKAENPDTANDLR